MIVATKANNNAAAPGQINENEKKSKVYFPGLNALRFFAASMVVLGHIEQIKAYHKWPTYKINQIFGDPVTFFFVLSGFLITYLLFKEKEVFNSINTKKFYSRRILRIWPLYYLIFLIGYAILPNIDLFKIPGLTDVEYMDSPGDFLLFLFMLPNLAHTFGIGVSYALQYWSIGVEEQFYLIWPLLIKNSKKYLFILVSIIVVFLVGRNGAAFFSKFDSPFSETFHYLNTFLISTRFGCMAIGGLGAYFLFFKPNIFHKFFINRQIELLSYLCLFLLGYNNIFIPYIDSEVYSLIYLLIIVNISCNPNSILKFENKVWTFLGNISYGIYMYQYLTIGFVLGVFRYLNVSNFALIENIGLHAMILTLTIFIAWISYKYFETPFLKLKENFTLIKSGS